MLFSMRGRAPQGNGKMVHCGVLEFTAEEGKCYAPTWMMKQIGVDEGGIVEVANVTLPLGTYVKVQPHSSTFIDNISNHRAVLEYALKSYAALTVGDNIVFRYNKRDYVLSVNEVKPDSAANNHAISVVETNIQIDFDPPKDTLAADSHQPSSAGPGLSSSLSLSSSSSSASSKKGFFKEGSLESLKFYDPDCVGSSSLGGGDGSNDEDTSDKGTEALPAKKASLQRSTGYRVDGKPIKKSKKKKKAQARTAKEVSGNTCTDVGLEDDDDDNDDDGNGEVEVVPFTGIGRSLSGAVVNNGPRLTRSKASSEEGSLSQSGLSVSSNADGNVSINSLSSSVGTVQRRYEGAGHTLKD